MLQSNYQRVGALAGLLLFLGAWLSVFYDHWAWTAATIIAVLAAFWLALENETSEDLGDRAKKGMLIGVIAASVARILGLISMVWAFDSWSAPATRNYDSISDLFRIILNGDLTSSLLAILGVGLVGAFMAYAMPYFTTDREEE